MISKDPPKNPFHMVKVKFSVEIEFWSCSWSKSRPWLILKFGRVPTQSQGLSGSSWSILKFGRAHGQIRGPGLIKFMIEIK
jgi:hypothetical protein